MKLEPPPAQQRECRIRPCRPTAPEPPKTPTRAGAPDRSPTRVAAPHRQNVQAQRPRRTQATQPERSPSDAPLQPGSHRLRTRIAQANRPLETSGAPARDHPPALGTHAKSASATSRAHRPNRASRMPDRRRPARPVPAPAPPPDPRAAASRADPSSAAPPNLAPRRTLAPVPLGLLFEASSHEAPLASPSPLPDPRGREGGAFGASYF